MEGPQAFFFFLNKLSSVTYKTKYQKPGSGERNTCGSKQIEFEVPFRCPKKSSRQLKPRGHDWAEDETCEVAFGLVFVDEVNQRRE